MSIKLFLKRLILASRIPPLMRFEYLNQMFHLGVWAREHCQRKEFSHRYEMFAFLNSQILRNSPITYLEFGVFKGESIRKWAEINTNPESRFVGFDSFEGLPENWSVFFRVLDQASFDTEGKTPQIDDRRVTFVKGWFQNSLPIFLEDFRCFGRLVVHLDADLYSSTLYVLTRLHPLLVSGAILIFDEFNAVTHEFRAFRDYASAYRVHYEVLGSSGVALNQVAIEVKGVLKSASPASEIAGSSVLASQPSFDV